MATLQRIKNRLDSITREIEDFLNSAETTLNSKRRRLYSEVELLRLDFEEFCETNSATSDDIKKDFHKSCDNISSKLNIVPIKRERHWWHGLDVLFRFVAVSVGLITVGTFCALPMILLRPIDKFLMRTRIISSKYQLSEALKRNVCRYMLYVAGIVVSVEGLREKTFEECCVLLTFSHASNLDGYLVSCTCPVRHYALAKKELFLVPFFSWIAFAMGGVPVDRENRDRAISALQR